MFNFSDYAIPVWHPLLVHLPIVLIPLGFLALCLFLYNKEMVWRRICLFLYAFSLIFGYLAYTSGETLEHQTEGEAQTELFVHDHENGAKAVIALTLMIFSLLCVAEIRQRQNKKIPQALYITLFVMGLTDVIAIAYTGHLGALMTWGIPV
jgi:uncharacterized membrane protein